MDQLLRLLGRSGSRWTTPAPAWTAVVQLGAGHAEEEDRRAGRDERDVLDQVEQRLLGPVDVVEDEHQRLLARDRLDELAERPGQLVGRGRAGAPEQRASGSAIAASTSSRCGWSCVSVSRTASR